MPHESTCINHPSRPATGRCKRCNIPLCSECKLVAKEGTFCSEKCLAQTRVFMDRAKELGRDVRSGRSRFPGRVVVVIAVLIGLFVLLRFKFGVTSFAQLQSFLLGLIGR